MNIFQAKCILMVYAVHYCTPSHIAITKATQLVLGMSSTKHIFDLNVSKVTESLKSFRIHMSTSVFFKKWMLQFLFKIEAQIFANKS